MSTWKPLVEGKTYIYAPEPTKQDFQHRLLMCYMSETVTFMEESDTAFVFKRRNGEKLCLPNKLFIYETIQPKHKKL